MKATDQGVCKLPVLVSDCVVEEHDGELKSWINRERFPNYSKIDSFTLYAMGDSGNPGLSSTTYRREVELVRCLSLGRR